MSRFLHTIVCGVDDSAPARCAALVAVHVARATDARIVFVHVNGVAEGPPAGSPVGTSVPSGPVWERLGTGEATERDIVRWLSDFAAEAGAADAEQIVAPFGDPARRLAAVADERAADLLVVASGGASAARDAMLGSISARLAADAPAPVMVVPRSVHEPLAPGQWAGRRVVCGFDGSESAYGAARFAAALAARVGADLQLVCVLDGASESPDPCEPPDAVLHAAAGAASPASAGETTRPISIAREQRLGEPAEELERVAAAATAPLIVMGARGRLPWRAPLLGSVSRAVIDRARRPVVLVPPAALQ